MTRFDAVRDPDEEGQGGVEPQAAEKADNQLKPPVNRGSVLSEFRMGKWYPHNVASPINAKYVPALTFGERKTIVAHDVVVNGLRRLVKIDICVFGMEVVRMDNVDSIT
ncbi:MAG: hypothetical protein SGPRY_014932 [Prymnesium sp.]